MKQKNTWTRKDAYWLLGIVALAAVVRFVPAIFYKNYFDIGSYNIPWAVYGAQDRFGIYGPLLSEFGMDYPPMFPFALTLFGNQVLAAREAGFWQLEMFYIKLVPVLADICLTALVFFIAKDYGVKRAWLPALLWAVNPASVYNCSVWGQSDCILLFFLLAMGWALWRRQPELAAVAFAFGCLSKLQMCYYAPMLLLGFLAMRAKPLRWVTALGVGGFVGFLGWLPFMRRGEWLHLPLRIYFGGYEKYSFINLQAANVFALGDYYHVPDDTPLLGSLSFHNISTLITAAALLWLVVYGVLLAKRRTRLPVACAALLYANIIFLFTTRQHERYQMPVLVLALLCWLETREKPYAVLSIVYALITFANQFILLSGETIEGWYGIIAPGIAVVAVVNLAAFGYLLFFIVRKLATEWKETAKQPTAVQGGSVA